MPRIVRSSSSLQTHVEYPPLHRTTMTAAIRNMTTTTTPVTSPITPPTKTKPATITSTVTSLPMPSVTNTLTNNNNIPFTSSFSIHPDKLSCLSRLCFLLPSSSRTSSHPSSSSSTSFFRLLSSSSSSSSSSSPLIILFPFLSLLSLLFFLLFKHVAPCHSRWSYYYQHACPSGIPHPWLHPSSSSPSLLSTSRNVAVAMVLDDDFFDIDLRNRTIENKRTYARRWGYHLVVPDTHTLRDLIGDDKPVAWAKLPLLKRLLFENAFDYVLMIDADAVILRPEIGLNVAFDTMETENTSLLISNDMTGPNSGIFILRRSQWSYDFLTEAQAISLKLSDQHSFLPLRFENRAFLYLLGAWPRCLSFPRVDTLNAPVSPNVTKFRRGVTTVDRCLINRRPKRDTSVGHFFRNSGSGFDDLSDAFIGHSAGGKGAHKQKSIWDMLQLADRKQRLVDESH